MINSLSLTSDAVIAFLKPSQSSPLPVSVIKPAVFAASTLLFLRILLIAVPADFARLLARLSFMVNSPSGEAYASILTPLKTNSFATAFSTKAVSAIMSSSESSEERTLDC